MAIFFNGVSWLHLLELFIVLLLLLPASPASESHQRVKRWEHPSTPQHRSLKTNSYMRGGGGGGKDERSARAGGSETKEDPVGCFWTPCNFDPSCPAGTQVFRKQKCGGFTVQYGKKILREAKQCCADGVNQTEEEYYSDDLCLVCPKHSHCNKLTARCVCNEGYEWTGSVDSSKGFCRLSLNAYQLKDKDKLKDSAHLNDNKHISPANLYWFEMDGEGKRRIRPNKEDVGHGEGVSSSESFEVKEHVRWFTSVWNLSWIPVWMSSGKASWAFIGLFVASFFQVGLVVSMVCVTILRMKRNLAKEKSGLPSRARWRR